MEAKRYPAHVFWSDDGNGFIALAPDLPGCSAFGESRFEALSELVDVIEAWIAAARAAGNPTRAFDACGARASVRSARRQIVKTALDLAAIGKQRALMRRLQIVEQVQAIVAIGLGHLSELVACFHMLGGHCDARGFAPLLEARLVNQPGEPQCRHGGNADEQHIHLGAGPSRRMRLRDCGLIGD
jgi:predicted RNase H-like HicB family nuclease